MTIKISRREFLKSTVTGFSAITTLPFQNKNFLPRMAVFSPEGQEPKGDVLVVVFQRGGMDALNDFGRPQQVQLAIVEKLAQFVPDAYRGLAFADSTIPIGAGQIMLPPKIQGRLLQALAPSPDESALDIGTGTGFLAACLARMAASVRSIEIDPDLSEQATTRLAAS